MASTLTDRTVRASTACVSCHKRKVRCNIAESQPCSNCRATQRECLPRARKRRRYTLESQQPSTGPSLLDVRNNEISAAVAPAQRSQTFETCQESSNVPTHASDPTHNLPTSCENDNSIHLTPVHQTSAESYLGRSEYMGSDVQVDERLAQSYAVRRSKYAALDRSIMEQQQAFNMPPQIIRKSLIDSCIKNCSPWMPILDELELEERTGQKPSILLLQAVFLAGSRMCSSPLEYTSCEDLYRRAKTLFYLQYEQSIITVIKSVCLMQWWNPTGPEHVSLDKGSFWLRISVGLAFEIGLHRDPGLATDASLRRRLWWTIYTRDCLISAGQGRPRAINIEDCSVRPISINDFPRPNKASYLFVAYVQICSILGDLAQCCLRNTLSYSRRAMIERDLRRWSQELPPCLQLYEQYPVKKPAAYDIDIRQLHVPYLTALTILNKPPSSTSSPSAVAILASSLVAGIFEDFLLRDDVKYLNSIFTFHLLVAGFSQRLCLRYHNLRGNAAEGLKIITFALREMSEKWDSAIGPLKVIQGFSNDSDQDAITTTFPSQQLDADQMTLFAPYGTDFCRMWDTLLNCPNHTGLESTVENNEGVNADIPTFVGLVDPVHEKHSETTWLDFDFTSYGLFQDFNCIEGGHVDYST